MSLLNNLIQIKDWRIASSAAARGIHASAVVVWLTLVVVVVEQPGFIQHHQHCPYVFFIPFFEFLVQPADARAADQAFSALAEPDISAAGDGFTLTFIFLFFFAPVVVG